MSRSRGAIPKIIGGGLVVATTLFFSLPLLGLLVRVPWGEFADRVGSREVVDALRLSLQASFAAAGLSLLFGLPTASWLARGNGPLRTIVRGLVTLPMVLPPIVGGVLLLLAFGRRGLIGSAFDVTLPFTSTAVVLAATYVAMPFFVLTVEAGLRSFDSRYSEAAATLGSSPLRTFLTVTLPLIAPSLRAGLVVAWARALGEFGATITFAGNVGGRTRTLPLAVFGALESDPDAALVLSALLVMLSVLLLALLRRHWWPAR